MIRWIASFLHTQIAQASVSSSLSRKVRMQQGLPQASVLAPLLFLLFINDLAPCIPENIEGTMFADDLALYVSHVNPDEACKLLQQGVTAVEDWSSTNKLDLNLVKSCTFFFTTNNKEAKYRPNITLGGKRMPFGDGPKELDPPFLGIIMDRSLAFTEHVRTVCKKVSKRCKMLGCLASRSWGWHKQNLKGVYLAAQRSIMDYAAGGWQPWLSSTQMGKLEVTQNKCLRMVTGQYANSHLDSIHLESGIPSYKCHSKVLIAIAYEKGMRAGTDHPRRIALDKEVHHRLKTRSSLREMGESLAHSLSLSSLERCPDPTPIFKPWSKPRKKNWYILTNQEIKSDVPQILSTIDRQNAVVTIYTDGSCSGGVKDGGAAAVITTGPASSSVELEIS